MLKFLKKILLYVSTTAFLGFSIYYLNNNTKRPQQITENNTKRPQQITEKTQENTFTKSLEYHISKEYKKVKEVNCDINEIKKIINDDRNFIFEIGAKWCGACRAVKDYFEDNVDENKKINFYYLDKDLCEKNKTIEVISLFNKDIKKIYGVPLLFYVKEKNTIDYINCYDKRWLENILKK